MSVYKCLVPIQNVANQKFVIFKQEDGSDKLEFICDVDLGRDVPTSWEEALDLLKNSFANELVLRTFPAVFDHCMVIITVYGVRRLLCIYYFLCFSLLILFFALFYEVGARKLHKSSPARRDS